MEALVLRAAALATSGPQDIVQDDTFFNCDQGRLKLRAFSAARGELIFYRRADSPDPKESFYLISSTASPDTMRELLTAAHGQAGRVQKRRTLFLVGRTRIHLDRVKDLGDFLELEVVLADGEAAEDGMAEAHALMEQLNVSAGQLVTGAYVDLLRAGPLPSAHAAAPGAEGSPVSNACGLHHVEIYVADLARSIGFWEPLLQRLGYAEFQRWASGVSYLHGDTYLVFVQAEEAFARDGFHRKRVGLNHLAFHAASRQQVDEIATWVTACGHTLLYPHTHPFAGGPDYYAVYCEDPDRIKVEIVAPFLP